MHDPSPSPNEATSSETRSEEISSKLLSELLELTLSERKRSLTEEEWNGLREVVKRFESSPTAFEDLIVAMVQAFLTSRLSTNVKSSDALHRMSASIARALCGDPNSRQRLMVFQQQLSERQ